MRNGRNLPDASSRFCLPVQLKLGRILRLAIAFCLEINNLGITFSEIAGESVVTSIPIDSQYILCAVVFSLSPYLILIKCCPFQAVEE